MKDSEVGQLWRQCFVEGEVPWPKAAMDLIYKLVEERADFYARGFKVTPDDIKDALNDFGIDPTQFERSKRDHSPEPPERA